MEAAHITWRPLGRLLVEQGLLDARVLTQALATQLGLPTIDLRRERPTPEALALIPESVAREHRIMPMRLYDDVLDVAVADGASAAVREQLAHLPVSAVNIYLAPQTDVVYALDTHYRVLSAVDDERYSRSFDLLFRGLELVTGGQRLHRASAYDEAIRGRGEDPADYAAYLQAFRHGMPPHGGFAVGLERWVGRLVEATNIREVTLFPRDLHRLTP